MNNPFKFGTIVENEFFTNRENEINELSKIIESENHLVLIAPRRFGKTSLISKIVKNIQRPTIWIDLQMVTSVDDFASQLLKGIFKIYPFEKIKFAIRNFRIVPTLSVNPMTNNVEVAFQPHIDGFIKLEDVLNLIETFGKNSPKPIVVVDEFQEIMSIEKKLDKKLRSVIQLHKNCNYVFMGSSETMMREIFERKKSPFYHFGALFTLGKIPHEKFRLFLEKGFHNYEQKEIIAEKILNFTNQHPYYTQQLAFYCWNYLRDNDYNENSTQEVINNIIKHHNNDFERIWLNLNNTDKKVMISLSEDRSPLKTENLNLMEINSTSTAFSAIKRLLLKGLVMKTANYEIDDPFFKEWIKQKRS